MDDKFVNKKEYIYCFYDSPLGEILLESDSVFLTGLWFKNSKYAKDIPKHLCTENDHPAFKDTVNWLDVYFSGIEPDFMPRILLRGTSFQLEVWEILKDIAYGQKVTYGDIAKKIAKKKNIGRMSPQAVGTAVGRNPICIIVPCHRVVGSRGELTGYAAGIDKKLKLLQLEKSVKN